MMRPPVEPLLTVSAPPHAHCGRLINGYVIETIVALLPAALAATIAYGFDAVRVMALAGATAVAAEYLWDRMQKQQSHIDDFHALLTGLLLAFLLPASAPWWLVVMGAVVSVFLGKSIMGGLGASPLCPPVLGWAVLRISWPLELDTNASMLNVDIAAPLQQLKYFGVDAIADITPMDLLMGHQLGGLGAAQAGMILAGGIFLLIRRHIRPDIPLSFLAGVALTAWIFQMAYPETTASPLFHILAGSTLFGAFFLATDPPSSPVGHAPMIVYGLIGGAMVMVIRVYGVYPDGVPFAILLANLFTPTFDRIRPKPFGFKKA